jgi:hypothetical protein
MIVVLGYSTYRIYPLISGPKITIISPSKGEVVSSEVIKIKGIALRAKEVKVFDRIISIDPEGNFEEEIIKQHPYTDVIVTAKDKYGRIATQKLFVQ